MEFPLAQTKNTHRNRRVAAVAVCTAGALACVALFFVYAPALARSDTWRSYLSLLSAFSQLICFLTAAAQMANVLRQIPQEARPVPPRALLRGGGVVCLFALGAALTLPPMLYIGVSLGMEPLFYPKAFLLAAAQPALPLALAGASALFFQRLGARRSALIGRVLAALSVFCLAAVLCLGVLAQGSEITPALSLTLKRLTVFYPPGLWAGMALYHTTAHGTLYLFYSLLLPAALSYAVFRKRQRPRE